LASASGFSTGVDAAAAGIDTAAVAGSIDCLGERDAIEVLECFRDMTPEQRSTCARREAPAPC